MCGIAGYFGPKKLTQETLHAVTSQMEHRGPDWSGQKNIEVAGCFLNLLHVRLSIIDLDQRSNQPFDFEHISVIFNGEIYNYRELRAELIALGHVFYTSSDTEVLARSIFEWGYDAADKFEGMWSFACFNGLTEELWLSRDRFGEKPLYFIEDGKNLYFASEIKSLLSLLPKPLAINRSHLARYLINGYKSLFKTDEDFFTNLKRVEAGEILVFKKGQRFRSINYWNRISHSNKFTKYSEAVDAIRSSLINSVRLRLRADVPIAFCLSGGVDSNGIISIAKNILNYDVHGFTIVNDDGRYEEREAVNLVVKSQDLKHSEVRLDSANFIDDIKNMIEHRASPVSTITFYAHWLLMQKISEEGYKVSVSGTGADEVFSGYHDHFHFFHASISDNENHLNKALRDWDFFQKGIVRNPGLQDPKVFINHPNKRDHIFLNRSEYLEMLQIDWDEDFSEDVVTQDLLRNRMYNEMFAESVPVLLSQDDLNAMSFSIENRSPYLDTGIYETAQKIPTEMLIKDGFAKAVLRDALRGIVPDHVLNSRKKVGFNAPIASILDLENKNSRDFLFESSPIFEMINKEKLEKFVKDGFASNSASKFLFNFVNAKIFMESFG